MPQEGPAYAETIWENPAGDAPDFETKSGRAFPPSSRKPAARSEAAAVRRSSSKEAPQPTFSVRRSLLAEMARADLEVRMTPSRSICE